MSSKILLQPFKSRHLDLKNRVIMAPLTRGRATENNMPTDIMQEYYKPRSSAGLIISEAAPISEMGIGYMRIPGIFIKEQIKEWRKIADVVHKEDGQIFMQLWHVGRNSHPDLLGGKTPVSASNVGMRGGKETPSGKKPYVAPLALTIKEINQIIKDYAKAAKNAMEAGFDGVQIHGANGYLIDQFLNDNTNLRDDVYGQTIENKSRFALEVCDAVCSAIGNERTSIRLSPIGIAGQVINEHPIETHDYLISKLNDFDLAFLEVLESLAPLEKLPSHYPKKIIEHFRQIYNGVLMTNANFSFETANNLIASKTADLVSFGRLFISNPDLVKRFEHNYPLNEWDKYTFYSKGEKGYTDYPFYKE